MLAEPVMTNIGIIHPDPGYWEKARELCDKYGTLLIIDETHTISAGPQGYAVLNGIKPDIFVIGKRTSVNSRAECLNTKYLGNV